MQFFRDTLQAFGAIGAAFVAVVLFGVGSALVEAGAGDVVNMAAWSDVNRIRAYSRSNPDKLLRETTRALDHAQKALEQYGAEIDLFADIELRLFDVETRDQEVEALRSTIRAWKEIENSESAQLVLPVLENRLAELEMVPEEE